jgi:PAS domain S-box-containing protein
LLSEVALAVDDLLAAERRALAILTWSTGLVALLGTLLGLWYVRQVIAPLRKLTTVAGQISEGDLMAPIPNFENPVEVSTLATALQQSQASMLWAIEERSQARDWLDTLIQSIVEGVVTFDAEGRITFLSQGAELLTGWQRDEALGRHVNDVFPVTRDWEVSFLEALPPPREKRQISIHTHAGKATTLAISGTRLVPPGEETVQTALVLRDVTQEDALRHLRSYFLANISHEFRTPLSTLNASIELLLEEVDSLSAAEIRELLKPTHLSLRGLQNLIDNLLESSSIEAGRFVLHQRPVELNQVIHNALRVIQPLLDRRRQQVTVEEPANPPELTADPGRLTQVLVNLLSNASKYSPIGEAIDLRVRQLADTLRISVADRGPGIPPEERVNVFRRFVRLTATDGEQYGVGLGLFVVRTTIEAHGGRVGVNGRPDGGSVFWFELPLVQSGVDAILPTVAQHQ